MNIKHISKYILLVTLLACIVTYVRCEGDGSKGDSSGGSGSSTQTVKITTFKQIFTQSVFYDIDFKKDGIVITTFKTVGDAVLFPFMMVRNTFLFTFFRS